MDRQTDEWTNGRTNRQMDVQTDRWTDKQTDGRTNRQMDYGWTDEQKEILTVGESMKLTDGQTDCNGIVVFVNFRFCLKKKTFA